jgi:hypothetical protein
MSHLEDDELERWRQRGDPADRDRILGHLATCDRCRERLADLVRNAPEVSATSFDPAPFVQRGVAAFDKTRPGGMRAWWLGFGGLAVAAASLFLILRPTPPTETPVEIRGSDLQALAPIGNVSSVPEFRWASPFAATRYRVIVRDASDASVLELQSTAEHAPVPTESTSKLPPGSYKWVVEALDATGSLIASSQPQAFTIGR